MQQHLLHQHLTGILHPQRHHGQTVPHEHDIHTRMVRHMRRREIMRRDDGDGLTLAMQGAQRAHGDLFALVGWGCAHGGVGAVTDLLVLGMDTDILCAGGGGK